MTFRWLLFGPQQIEHSRTLIVAALDRTRARSVDHGVSPPKLPPFPPRASRRSEATPSLRRLHKKRKNAVGLDENRPLRCHNAVFMLSRCGSLDRTVVLEAPMGFLKPPRLRPLERFERSPNACENFGVRNDSVDDALLSPKEIARVIARRSLERTLRPSKSHQGSRCPTRSAGNL
jgi:hypothetical protein